MANIDLDGLESFEIHSLKHSQKFKTQIQGLTEQEVFAIIEEMHESLELSRREIQIGFQAFELADNDDGNNAVSKMEACLSRSLDFSLIMMVNS